MSRAPLPETFFRRMPENMGKVDREQRADQISARVGRTDRARPARHGVDVHDPGVAEDIQVLQLVAELIAAEHTTAAKKSTRLTVEASTHKKVMLSMMTADMKAFFQLGFPLVSRGEDFKLFLRILYFSSSLNMQEGAEKCPKLNLQKKNLQDIRF